MAAPYDVYAERLCSSRHGLALYEPDPAGTYDHVRVGDVGYMHYGFFHRMFNILFDEDDPTNHKGVPEYFEPLPSEYRATYSRTSIAPGPICSSSVRDNGASLEISSEVVKAGATVKLSCKSKQGAALILKHPALRCDSSSPGALGKYMLNHYKEWHAFAKQHRDPCMLLRDIILVTGCDLTREWATVTFTEKASDASISFTVGVSPYASVGGSFWGSWSSNVSAPHRCGPDRRVIADGIAGLIADSSTSIPITPTNNQCVFIRTLRVQERPLFIPNVLKAAAGPPDQNFHKDADHGSTILPDHLQPHIEVDDSSSFQYGVELAVNDGSSGRGIGALYDTCFQYLFENSSANVAILHDDDIMDTISDHLAERELESWIEYPPVFPTVKTSQGTHLGKTVDVVSFSPTFEALNADGDLDVSYGSVSTAPIKTVQSLDAAPIPVYGEIIYDEPNLVDGPSTFSPGTINRGKLKAELLEEKEAVLSPNHPDTLTNVSNLATLYVKLRFYQDAESLEVKVLEERRRVLGPDHPDTLTSMINLVSCYLGDPTLDKDGSAGKLSVEVLETRKRLLGLTHPDTLTSTTMLASTYWAQRRWAEAEKLDIEVLEARKRVLGPDHPDTLVSLTNLASKRGRFDEAKKLKMELLEKRKRVLEANQRMLGFDHPATLTSMENLASTYNSQHRMDEAVKLGSEVLDARKRVLGSEHPDTLASTTNLALMYKSQRRLRDYMELGRIEMGVRRRVLGPELLAVWMRVLRPRLDTSDTPEELE